jgi:hypothetical protein
MFLDKFIASRFHRIKDRIDTGNMLESVEKGKKKIEHTNRNF